MSQVGPSSEFERALDAVRAGHGLGFEYLWNRFSRQVSTFARLQGGEDPEGTTNTVFVAAFQLIDRFEGGEKEFVALLFSISRNKLIDEQRKAGRRVVSSPLDEVGHDVFGGHVEDDAFAGLSEGTRAALARLTADQREVLFLRLVADLSLELVATMTNRTVGATKALQHRALAAMRREISTKAVSK